MVLLRLLRFDREPKKAKGTVVAVRFLNLATLIDRYFPEDILPGYTRCLNKINADIKKMDGKLAKVEGDLMDLYFQEKPGLDQAELACRAAFLIRKRLDELNEDHGRLGLGELKCAIGLHTGEIEITKDKVFGSAIEVAEAVTAECGSSSDDILISEDVFKALGQGRAYAKMKEPAPGRQGLPPVYKLFHLDEK